VEHVPYSYFTAFPSLISIRGNRNFLAEPFLLPVTLVRLFLSYNRLTSAFAFFNRSVSYKKLKQIELKYNNMARVQSKEFSDLPSLDYLNLGNMRPGIRDLEPFCITNLPKLKKLRMSRNKLRRIDKEALINLGSQGLSFLLDLGSNEFTEIPADFVNLTYVSDLHLDKNGIEYIHPAAFRLNMELNEISLSSNKLERLEEGTFDAFLFVTYLNLDGNFLRDLPRKVFRDGAHIVKLTLADNKIEELDDDVFTGVFISALDMSSNLLTKLPKSLSSQRYLVYLDLLNNNLTVVQNNTFDGLTDLVTLNLMKNNISLFEPGSLDSLHHLKTLYLDGNPLDDVPYELFRFLENATVSMNCPMLKQLPLVPRSVQVNCLSKSLSVNVTVGCTAAKGLYRSGFMCRKRNMAEDNLPSDLCECHECPIGHASSLPKDITLTSEYGLCLCSPPGGWFQDETGQSSFKKCVNGTFVHPRRAPGIRPQDCKVCPTGTNTSRHAGYRACGCLEGYYRLDRFGPCYPCNSTSPGLRCVNESASVKRGYWWSWESARDQMNNYLQFIKNLTIKNESYSTSSAMFNGTLPKVYRCPTKSSCSDGVTSQEICATGYTGPLCAVCAKHFYSWFNMCQPCGRKWLLGLQLALTALLFCILLSALYWSDRFSRRDRRVTTLLDRIAGKTKIVVGLVQVMGDVIAAFSYIPWPVALLYVASKLKTIGMNLVEFTNVSCFGESLRMNALVKPIFSVTVQAVFVVAIFVYYQTRYWILPKLFSKLSSNPENISLARRSCFRNSWWLIFLCYPATATYIVATLPFKRLTCLELCQYEDQKDCSWKLKADLSVECNYNKQTTIVWIFCWCLIIYVIVLPCLAAWALLKRHQTQKQRSSMNLEAIPCSDTEIDDDDMSPIRRTAKEDLMDSLEFLDENYKCKFWYWELVEILRKLLLTCGVQYLGTSGLSGVAVASIIASLFLMFHAQFQPIKRSSEHWLQLFSLLLVSCNLMLGTLIALQQATAPEGESNSTDSVVFSVLVLLINISFVVYIGVKILVSACKGLRAAKKTARKFKCIVCILVCLTGPDELMSDSSSHGDRAPNKL
jgi:Leucine-rich repeat (LRR) protein